MPGFVICLISIGDEDFIARVSIKQRVLEVDPALSVIFRGKESFLKAEISRSKSIDEFCDRMFAFVVKLVSNNVNSFRFTQNIYFHRVIDDIRKIEWKNITSIDPCLSSFTVTLLDQKSRKIDIVFGLQNDFPRSPPIINSDLPIQIQFEWDQYKSTLKSIVDKHKEAIPLFSPFWEQFEDIDKNTRVIEPRNPPRSSNTRLIYISPQLWVFIEVNPKRPFFRPNVKFKGSEQLRIEKQRDFDEKAIQWNPSISLRKNMEIIMGMVFPPPIFDEEDEDFECPICFSTRFGGELPEIVCENPKCSKHYHKSCLVDWLTENKRMEHGYKTIYGKCPNCQTKISISDPSS